MEVNISFSLTRGMHPNVSKGTPRKVHQSVLTLDLKDGGGNQSLTHNISVLFVLVLPPEDLLKRSNILIVSNSSFRSLTIVFKSSA